jgi:hypothetical protein
MKGHLPAHRAAAVEMRSDIGYRVLEAPGFSVAFQRSTVISSDIGTQLLPSNFTSLAWRIG